jgi:uncharacterized protein with HEPN domain
MSISEEAKYLQHILDEASYIVNSSVVLNSYDDFIINYDLRHAYYAAVCIIGEASKNLSKEFRAKHSEVEWKKIIGMRNYIAHNYAGTNYFLLYNVVKKDIPQLKINIERIIKDIEEQKGRP